MYEPGSARVLCYPRLVHKNEKVRWRGGLPVVVTIQTHWQSDVKYGQPCWEMGRLICCLAATLDRPPSRRLLCLLEPIFETNHYRNLGKTRIPPDTATLGPRRPRHCKPSVRREAKYLHYYFSFMPLASLLYFRNLRAPKKHLR